MPDPIPPLFSVEYKRPAAGPVYQGVTKQIRRLERDGVIHKATHAGTIAQARSIAESIDRVSGHADPDSQASGMQLAALHERLESLLATLAPEQAETDPFQDLLDQLNDDESTGDGSTTETPHTP